jgi:hypothetical protein
MMDGDESAESSITMTGGSEIAVGVQDGTAVIATQMEGTTIVVSAAAVEIGIAIAGGTGAGIDTGGMTEMIVAVEINPD